MAAQKVTVQDVLDAGGHVGHANLSLKGVPHIQVIKGAESETLCNGKPLFPGGKPEASTDVCANCARKFITSNEESDMPAAKKTAAAKVAKAEAAPAEPSAPIEGQVSLSEELTEGQAVTVATDDSAENAPAEGEGFPTDGSATKKVVADAKAKADAAKAEADDKGGEKGKEVEKKGKTTTATDVSSDAVLVGLVSLATQAAKDFRAGDKQQRAATDTVGDKLMELATIILHEGKPDLTFKSAGARKARALVFEGAGFVKNKARADGTYDEQTLEAQRFDGALRVKLMDKRVILVREFAADPEKLALYPGAKTADDIFDIYDIKKRTTQAEDYAAKQLDKKKKAELEAAKPKEESPEETAEAAVTAAKEAPAGERAKKTLNGTLAALEALDLSYLEGEDDGEPVDALTILWALRDRVAEMIKHVAPEADWEKGE
ncbi:hypothetical protein OG401_23890 [Kitasatospora purpeofusca]|uniref:hypothetical protein n=1 Tax=Kitasatospora purpeofusca TaxID=67352 RepID=UPI0022576E81|nr:hypothetical protein [Kitasatospora purpeofusca]MCX4687306.1 hypothetical protein [Kitasatospora purpeofusca]